MATLRPYKQLPPLSLASASPRRPRALAAPLAATLWNSLVLPPSPAPPSPPTRRRDQVLGIPARQPRAGSHGGCSASARGPGNPSPTRRVGRLREPRPGFWRPSLGEPCPWSLPSLGCQWPLFGF
ncbi:hypothetical protein NN561_000089 [Cricetulus griseus]